MSAVDQDVPQEEEISNMREKIKELIETLQKSTDIVNDKYNKEVEKRKGIEKTFENYKQEQGALIERLEKQKEQLQKDLRVEFDQAKEVAKNSDDKLKTWKSKAELELLKKERHQTIQKILLNGPLSDDSGSEGKQADADEDDVFGEEY